MDQKERLSMKNGRMGSRMTPDLIPLPDHPPLRSFSLSLPMSLLRAREAVMRHFRSNLRSFGLTEQQWRVLRALSSKNAVEVAELSELTFLLGPSLSRILKELEGRKVISRMTPDTDQRRGIISITAKGRQLIEEVGVDSEAIYAEITSRFGDKKLSTLQAMLGNLEEVLSGPLIANGGAKREPQRRPRRRA